MKLHNDKLLFSEIISRAAEHPVNGGLGIKPQFLEKDYWITKALADLSKSQNNEPVILKGGNSLSKGYGIGYRLSEDIDVGDMTKLFPYQKRTIKSFVYEYLISYGFKDIIKDFELEPFEMNVQDKRTTMTEELVTLFISSLGKSPVSQLETKIRYFYDLHYLYEDQECKNYLEGDQFIENFISLYDQDSELFDNHAGWNEKNLIASPLFTDLPHIWNKLSDRYYKELPPLCYSLSIPSADMIEASLIEIINQIKFRLPFAKK